METTTTVTEEYRRKAREEFKQWCRQHRPTLRQACNQTQIIARDVVRIGPEQAVLLLCEHPEWTATKPPSYGPGDNGMTTILEAIRRLSVQFIAEELEKDWLE